MIWRSVATKYFPKSPWGQNSNRQLVGDLKQVAIASDQHFRASCDSLCQDGRVGLILYYDAKRMCPCDNNGFPAQESIKLPDDLAGYSNLLSQYSLQLG